jgi:hypothetical protein
MFSAPVRLPCTSVIFVPSALASVPSIQEPSAAGAKTPAAHATISSPAGSFVDISVVGTTKPKIIGCVDTNPRLR